MISFKTVLCKGFVKARFDIVRKYNCKNNENTKNHKKESKENGKEKAFFFLVIAMLLSLFPQFTLPAAAAGRETLRHGMGCDGDHLIILISR